MHTENPQQKEQEKKRVTFMNAFSFASEFGFIIALPLIGLGLLGKWLDAKHHTKYFVLIGILIAIISSTFWISKRLKGIMESLKK